MSSTPTVTVEEAIALAPDTSSRNAARSLAVASSWTVLGADEQALWGACRGSAQNPYAVAVDLAGPAFRCSCPSRKFPCKHGLALALMAGSDPSAIPAADEPADVAVWLDGRGAKAKGAAGPPGGGNVGRAPRGAPPAAP